MFELLTAQEAAEFLRLKDPETAKKKLAEWGVQPYYLGKGRGVGYRYRKDEIFEALENTRISQSTKNSNKKKKPKKERTLMSELVEGNISASEFAERLDEDI